MLTVRELCSYWITKVYGFFDALICSQQCPGIRFTTVCLFGADLSSPPASRPVDG